ncbi:MAG: protein kinase, partial [Deltaproteobacteria bacterium]|nr:protein kinase [Deltaproteobacteria bacterium]
MAAPDDQDALGHTATLPAGTGTRPAPSERQPHDIDSGHLDLETLPVIDPETYVFGHYFARGGMGRIAAVRDKRLGRVVAIKELIANEPALIERFKREIRITARLEHPAIVSIHEAGQWPTGEPFFVMKKVAGRSLKEAIDARPMFEERLSLVASVIAIVDALAYAHQCGIIHRDLKPANVLVGEFGETVVIDWGLAKDLRAGEEADPIAEYAQAVSAHVTVAGSLLGTPAYMAPEQARGDVADERSDVYALGAILYTVLAGVPPYDGNTQAEVVARVLDEAPIAIGERQPAVPIDLQTIVARAMARAPGERYPSARELAADLKRFQTGQLVAAHKYSRGQLFARWLRRHRGSVIVGVAALVALVVLGTASLIGIVGERDRAVAAEYRSSVRSDALVIAQARSAVEVDPHQALRWLAELPVESAQWPAARLVAADAVGRGVPRPLPVAGDGDTEMALSADGRWLVAVGDHETIQLHDLATGGKRAIRTGGDRMTDVAITRDGSRIATGTTENTVVVWNADGSKRRTFTGHDGWVTGVSFTPDDKRVISTGLDRTTRVWDLEGDGVRVLQMRLRGRDVSRDGRWVVGLDRDSDRAYVWDTTSTTKSEIEGEYHALSLDGTLAWVEKERTIQLKTLATGARRSLAEVAEPITQLVFSADATQLIVGTHGGTVQVIDLRTDARWSYRASGSIRGLATPDTGAWIAAWSKDAPVHLIDARSHEGRILTGSRGGVMRSKDGVRLLTSDPKQRLLEWTTTSGSSVLAAHKSSRGIAVAPDGSRIAFGGANHVLRIWNAGTRETIDLAGHTAPITHAVWSPNGALIASVDEAKRAWLWDASTRRGVSLQGRAMSMLEFSPDGTRLAAPADDQGVRVWDVASGTMTLLPTQPWVGWIGFASDGRLAGISSDGMIRIWEPGSTRSSTVGTHGSIVHDAAFSPDGAWLATAGHDGIVRLWPRSGGEAQTFGGHFSWVT